MTLGGAAAEFPQRIALFSGLHALRHGPDPGLCYRNTLLAERIRSAQRVEKTLADAESHHWTTWPATQILKASTHG